MSTQPVSASTSSQPKIVGLLGQAGSGKDTVADFILTSVQGTGIALADPMKEFAQLVFGFTDTQLRGPSEYRNTPDERYGVYKGGRLEGARQEARLRLDEQATPWLKSILPMEYDLVAAYNGLSAWFMNAITNEVITPRYVLQTLGTEFGRSVSEDIWIDYGLRRAQEALARGEWAILKDVRFLNEAKKLRQLGCEVWRISRPSIDSNAVEKAGVSGHASEKEQKSPEMNTFVSKEILNTGTLDDLYSQVASLISK